MTPRQRLIAVVALAGAAAGGYWLGRDGPDPQAASSAPAEVGQIDPKTGKRVLYWQQPPGPTNALGQLKFVMPNSKAIYLHDTNARSRFNDSTRALSHGCVRTQHILDLATELLGDDNGQWTPDKIQAALDAKKSVQANFVKPLPVYIVYFSAAALLDGKIVDYKDLYGRDSKAMAAMQMKDGGASLVVPKVKDDQAEAPAAKPKPKPASQVATR